jgi:hypothetical protein
MTTAQEIALLEHELMALRSTYAIMQRNGQRMRVFFLFVLLPFVVGLTALILVSDFLAGLLVAIPLIVLGLLLWSYRGEGGRWIDIGTPGPQFNFGPSEAQKVELWIAVREKRLAELRSEDISN